MFNVPNKLVQLFGEDSDRMKIYSPIVSFDAMNYNQLEPNNLIIHKKLENYVDLNFKTDVTEATRNYYNYQILIPPDIENNSEIDKIVLVIKIDMRNVEEVSVILCNSTYDLRVSCLHTDE